MFVGPGLERGEAAGVRGCGRLGGRRRTTAGREGKPRKAGLLYVCAPKIAAEQAKKTLACVSFFLYNFAMIKRLEEMQTRFEELNQIIQDPELIKNPKKYKETMREHAYLS